MIIFEIPIHGLGGGDVPPTDLFKYRRSPAEMWGFGFLVLFANVVQW
jgi:hypothetical protein